MLDATDMTPVVTRGDDHMVMCEQPDNPAAQILPDMQVCRASDLTEKFAECLVEKPDMCQYAIPFGFSHLCGHPERRAIIDNTKRLQPQRRSR